MEQEVSLTVKTLEWMLSSNWLYPSKCILRPIPEPHDSIYANVLLNKVDLFDFRLRKETLVQEIGKFALRFFVFSVIQLCITPVGAVFHAFKAFWHRKDAEAKGAHLTFLKLDAGLFGMFLTTLPTVAILLFKNYKKTAALVSLWSIIWIGSEFYFLQKFISASKPLTLRYKFGLVGETGAPLKFSSIEDNEADLPIGKIGMMTYLYRVEAREYLYLLNRVLRIVKMDAFVFDFNVIQEKRAQYEPLFIAEKLPFDETLVKLEAVQKRMEVLYKMAEMLGSQMLAHPLHSQVGASFIEGRGEGRIDILTDIWEKVRQSYVTSLGLQPSSHVRFDQMRVKLLNGCSTQEFLDLPPDYDRTLLVRKRQELLLEFNHDRLTEIPQKEREAISSCINEAARLLEMELLAEPKVNPPQSDVDAPD